MSFPHYPKYKDSGVEWLGEVPEHWQTERLKRRCEVFPSNVDKKSVEGQSPVLLCNYTDVYYNDVIAADMDFMSATATEEQITKFTLRAGDTIITKDSETADDIAVAAYVPNDLDGVICGYHLSMIRPRDGIAGAFVKRLFDSNYARSSFAVRANGLTRVGLPQYAIDNIVMPFPPIAEQLAIAAFLDRETAKIDALIAEQQRLIELLQEKRQAVISHAVTKGLNPDAPMKDSGIEWLGEVPAHWELTKLGHCGRLQNGLSIGGEAFGEGDPFISYGDVYKNPVIPAVPSGLVRSSSQDQAKCGLKAGDVLFTRTSETVDDIGVASTCLTTIPRSTFAGFLIRFRPIIGILEPAYSIYLFRNQGVQGHFAGTMNLVTRASLSQGELRNLPICLPPRIEQAEIALALDRETKLLGELVTNSESAISLLQERRSALISAAVTGQIDVRGLAPKEAA
jgi:type I restriction enzyme S subunit